jgi:LPS sulfotransferase NodH
LAVCSNPRSGSTYLIFLLESTGVLGKPYEWLRGDGGSAHWDYADYPRDSEGQLEIMLRDGVTPNGVCSLKMFPEHFDTRTDSRWAERMPGLKYVHLVRQDLLGQAISLSLARQTDSYAFWMPAQREPIYDREHIRRCMDFIATGDARWRLFFANNQITPLTITYEELAASPQATIDRIAALMNVETATIDQGAFNTTVQRNALNEAWRERFVRDQGDLSSLPALDGVSFHGALWRPENTDAGRPYPWVRKQPWTGFRD